MPCWVLKPQYWCSCYLYAFSMYLWSGAIASASLLSISAWLLHCRFGTNLNDSMHAYLDQAIVERALMFWLLFCNHCCQCCSGLHDLPYLHRIKLHNTIKLQSTSCFMWLISILLFAKLAYNYTNIIFLLCWHLLKVASSLLVGLSHCTLYLNTLCT